MVDENISETSLPKETCNAFAIWTKASPISSLLLVTDNDGLLRALEFADHEARMHRLLGVYYGDYSLEKGVAPDFLLTYSPTESNVGTCRLTQLPALVPFYVLA
jgi:hypothetical protein